MQLPAQDDEWAKAYANYAEELNRFVADRVPATETEDLLQEVWSSLAVSLENTTIDQPRAWLYRVVRNRITDYYRRTAGQPAFQDLTPELDVETEDYDFSSTDPDETWAEIEAALEELPPKQREVFVRNELDGETLREIAIDLDIPLKTVISRKGYARNRLQGLLQEVYEDYFGID